ncbi:hypothetical protein U1Q18_044315 [Sarracenia purpurea var. burkii]
MTVPPDVLISGGNGLERKCALERRTSMENTCFLNVSTENAGKTNLESQRERNTSCSISLPLCINFLIQIFSSFLQISFVERSHNGIAENWITLENDHVFESNRRFRERKQKGFGLWTPFFSAMERIELSSLWIE